VSRVRFNEGDLELFRPKVQKILSLSKLCRGKIKISPGILASCQLHNSGKVELCTRIRQTINGKQSQQNREVCNNACQRKGPR
jgi:hypothetical protein